jgi:hypothetical protein
MTYRSMPAGANPTVIIKAGVNVTVKGHESELVITDANDKWGLKFEKRAETEFGRARAAIGDYVLFDVHLKRPRWPDKDQVEQVIDIQFGGSGEIWVPFGANLKIYSGKDMDIQGIQGQVDAVAGLKLNLQEVYRLGAASAGGTMNVDCQTLAAQTLARKNVEYQAGDDLRFHVHDLTSARIRVKDIGGYWEALIGEGERSVYLKSGGGDVTLVTDQRVEALPPNYILGRIERPENA